MGAQNRNDTNWIQLNMVLCSRSFKRATNDNRVIGNEKNGIFRLNPLNLSGPPPFDHNIGVQRAPLAAMPGQKFRSIYKPTRYNRNA